MNEPLLRRRTPGCHVPRLLDAILSVVPILLIALTFWLFGIGATEGLSQVALLPAAAFAAFIAFDNAYAAAEVVDATVGDVSSGLGAVSAVPERT